MFKRSLVISICILACLNMWCGCSRQATPPPPPPPPAATQTAAPQNTSPKEPEAPTVSREERVEAIAKDKFELYERKIRVADFPRAEATLRDLRAVFDMESAHKAFWDKAIPHENRVALTLMSLCETCKDGKCPLCKGTAKCNVCNGDGVCRTCEGRPIRKQACRACICPGCSGTGKCRTCSGFKNKKCKACQGYGTVGGQATVECRRCGGSGTVPGLKGPNGVTALKCLTCKGTGRVVIRTLNKCNVCQGKGSIPCPSCTGSGRCAQCGGSGRIAGCPQCGGSGQIVHKCPQCEGTGKCVNCQGTGQCTKCHGSGKCFECEGGLVKLYDFPMSSKWLTMKEGYVLFDSRLDKVVQKDEKIGFREIKYKDRNLSLIIGKSQIVFIATQPAFDSAVTIMKK